MPHRAKVRANPEYTGPKSQSEKERRKRQAQVNERPIGQHTLRIPGYEPKGSNEHGEVWLYKFDEVASKLAGIKARTFSDFAVSAKTARSATVKPMRQYLGTGRFVIPKPQGRAETVGGRPGGYTGLGGI
jgi:hypothetical protein